MRPFHELQLDENATIRKALEIIDSGKMKTALITDSGNRLIGVISDGDARRAILAGYGLDHSIKEIINKDFISAAEGVSEEHILSLARNHHIQLIPIVDESFVLLGVEDINDLITTVEYTNTVVLMVGGLGTRLRPLTENTPKPLLKVGNKPILETTVNNFASYGFKHFIFSVNYKYKMIEDYFQDGERLGVQIEYVRENKKMGTAGALTLMKSKLKGDFFVMNGDVLTNVNYNHLLHYHRNNKVDATMCVRDYDVQIPYGVVNTNAQHQILSIDEKPLHRYYVNAGIYVLNQRVLKFLPDNQFFDMPTLFAKLVDKNKITCTFPLREYWMDIGEINEYEKANSEFMTFFS